MKILYVTDLDGTLLNQEDSISNYSIEILNRLIKQGMCFTYATARSLSSASIVTKGLTSNIPVIVYNGAFIKNAATGETISSVLFDKKEIQSIIQLLSHHNIYPLVYSFINDLEKVSWYPAEENEGLRRYLNLRKGDKRLNPLTLDDNLYQGDIFYFTCIGEKSELEPIYNSLKDNDHYNCILQQELYREEYWCEIMPKKATKAYAIKQLKEIWQCDKVISFGDAINDIPMFQISDECYAVENAVPELKQIATGIIETNQKDGVAKWLNTNFDISKNE
jgi:Cof subfamily protein (haloacid dehalogenase superfamily)